MKGEKKGFFNLVYEAVKLIPKGKVSTYGEIAAFLGARDMAKFVGFALHANPSQSEIPCHRVVNRFGKLAKAFVFGGINAQELLLKSEGVEIENDTVDLKRFGITAEDLAKIERGEYK